jgi:SAM-dependent methyltransferase
METYGAKKMKRFAEVLCRLLAQIKVINRRERILQFITREQVGIEVGPWFAPIAPKKEGYNCWALDLFDAETLRRRAQSDPDVPKERIPEIEEVDLIGSATAIADLVAARGALGAVDYIISSHNLEHLPDPIRFLQGCEKVLKRGGILSMAIPDRRVCFDYFRPHTTLSAWLQAYFKSRVRPTFAQVFEQNSLRSCMDRDRKLVTSWSLFDDPHGVAPLRRLQEAFDSWKASLAAADSEYRDVHCWAFTPASFELLIRDLQFLTLLNFDILDVSQPVGNEFVVHLRKNDGGIQGTADQERFYEARKSLLHRVNDEAGFNSQRYFPRAIVLLKTFRLTVPLRLIGRALRKLRAGAIRRPRPPR